MEWGIPTIRNISGNKRDLFEKEWINDKSCVLRYRYNMEVIFMLENNDCINLSLHMEKNLKETHFENKTDYSEEFMYKIKVDKNVKTITEKNIQNGINWNHLIQNSSADVNSIQKFIKEICERTFFEKDMINLINDSIV